MSGGTRPAGADAGSAGEPTLIAGLTGIRAVMGLWVIADHLIEPMIRLFPALVVLRPMFSGGTAINTFFLLSGFVISHVYAKQLTDLDRYSYRGFLWKRVARLYPTHLFALLVTAAVVAAHAWHGGTVSKGSHYTVGTFLGNAAALQGVPGIDAWNIPSWSVTIEFAAYLVFPFLAAALMRLRAREALVLGLLVIIAAQYVSDAMAASPSLLDLAAYWVRPLGEFAFGSLLWVVWRRVVRRHRAWDIVAVASLTGVALILMGTSAVSGTRMLVSPLLGLFVLAVAGSAGAVLRVLTTRPVEWAGRTSYSRYLIHWPLLVAMWVVLPVTRFASQPVALRLALVLAWFVLPFVAGALVFRLVEEPGRRWCRRQGRRWGVDGPTARSGADPATGSARPLTRAAPTD